MLKRPLLAATNILTIVNSAASSYRKSSPNIAPKFSRSRASALTSGRVIPSTKSSPESARLRTRSYHMGENISFYCTSSNSREWSPSSFNAKCRTSYTAPETPMILFGNSGSWYRAAAREEFSSPVRTASPACLLAKRTVRASKSDMALIISLWSPSCPAIYILLCHHL